MHPFLGWQGFSSFLLPMPERMRAEDPGEAAKYDNIQLTLVDCPGHASLIRTIIGGAQIIDLVILVVDVVHGIQNQTAECLIIAEITTNDMIIVLNKVGGWFGWWDRSARAGQGGWPSA